MNRLSRGRTRPAASASSDAGGPGGRDDRAVRHARFDVAHLSVEEVDLPLKAAYLLVADTDDAVDPQWELLAYALDGAPLRQRTYRIDLTTLDGRALGGDAFLVRSVDGVHVLRGAGPLEGVDPTELS